MAEDVQTAQIVHEQANEAQKNVEVADQQENKQQQNFAALRERTEKVEQESLEKDRIIAGLKAQQQKEVPDYLKGEPDDWLTKQEMKKYDADVMSRVEKMLVGIKYPNAHELIMKYGKEVPARVANALQKSGDLEAAIEAIKMTPTYLKEHAAEHMNVAKAMENANKPKSTLTAGSTGAVSKSSRYASMTVKERMALQDRFSRGYGE